MEPNELNEKPKFNWQRSLITVGIVIVTAGVIGGTTWYVMNQQAKTDKTNTDKQVSELQKQVADLQKTQTKTTTTTPTPATTTTDPTAGWKTFSNSDYHFALKYPTDWTATTLTAGVRLTKNGQYFDVIGWNNPSALTTDAWLQQDINNKNIASVTVADKTTKTLGSYQVLSFTHNGQDTNYIYYFGSNGKMIELDSAYGADASIKTTMEDVIKTVTFN
jgi:uncharacterized protein YxeA